MTTSGTGVLVVGGGITGLAAAWSLTRWGREVVVLDQAPIGHRGGSSHGSCRIFRLGYDDPEYVPLAQRARELWSGVERESGECLLHPAPQLTFGPQMPQVLAALRQAGAAAEVLPAAEAARRFPGVRVPDGEVLAEPESAVIAANRALAVLAGALPDGCLRTGPRVTAIADDGRRVRVGTADGARFEADTVIVTAGPWTAGLLATAGISIPASATMEQVVYLSPAGQVAPRALPIVIHYGGAFAYGLPVPGSDRYKIGLHHGGPAVLPDAQEHDEDATLTRRTEQAARDLLPGLDPLPVAVERCVYDNSPDTDFIVDKIGNVVIGSGTSGHGFKFGPLLGEWLASLATLDDAPRGGPAGELPPRKFAANRFRVRMPAR